jgi:hypothetical protein
MVGLVAEWHLISALLACVYTAAVPYTFRCCAVRICCCAVRMDCSCVHHTPAAMRMHRDVCTSTYMYMHTSHSRPGVTVYGLWQSLAQL